MPRLPAHTDPQDPSLADASRRLTGEPAAAPGAAHTCSAGAAGAHAFDPARVEALRAALREGRYRVDPRRVADAFLRIELAGAHPFARAHGP